MKAEGLAVARIGVKHIFFLRLSVLPKILYYVEEEFVSANPRNIIKSSGLDKVKKDFMERISRELDNETMNAIVSVLYRFSVRLFLIDNDRICIVDDSEKTDVEFVERYKKEEFDEVKQVFLDKVREKLSLIVG